MSDFYENKLDLPLYDDDINYGNESEDLHNTFYDELKDNPLKEIYTLQHKQMVESLLYRTWIKEDEDINSSVKNCYDKGFVKDDYEESQILINMALEDCSNSAVNKIWEVKHLQSIINYSQFVIILEDGLAVMDKIQENSVQLIQNGKKKIGTFQTINIICGQEVYNGFVKNLDSKKEIFDHEIGLYKKVLNLAIANNSHQIFKNLLQQFIEQQTLLSSIQNENNLPKKILNPI
ncbi:hypothetical protein C1645_837636 [Glomus cerebriforme]|uniref:Uncharacterized protein n=1 Tax=Glomus cerebriforme TaxID=658196 RepID=A0A397S8A2_9GLOM|nr:hypothetical protein C1645_837636 [Glomus cerebriforme]